jgi:hypothetical protein
MGIIAVRAPAPTNPAPAVKALRRLNPLSLLLTAFLLIAQIPICGGA